MIADTTPDIKPHWSAAKCVGFRIVFVYLVLSQAESVVGLLAPGFRLFGSPIGPRAVYRMPWDRLAAWVGVHVFSIDARLLAPVGGSTDSVVNYVRTGLFMLTSLILSLIWSALTTAREHSALRSWLDDFVRCAVAMSLFFYGVIKVIPVQMLPIPLHTTGLVQPFGTKSPTGLLWAFVGYSMPYQMFAGSVELGSALLLLSRRTAPLGALGALAATASVFVLNMCYDVNLKLYTFNLLLAALFLAWPAMTALWRLFIMHEPVTPAPPVLSRPRGWLVPAGRVILIALMCVYGVQTIATAYHDYKQEWGIPAATPLYGVYTVVQLRKNAEEVPPLMTNTSRWRRMIMESPTLVRVQLMDDSLQTYRANYDAAQSQLTLFREREPAPAATFVWSVDDPDRVGLDGQLGVDHLALQLHRENLDHYLLLNRGFHWVQQNQTALIQ